MLHRYWIKGNNRMGTLRDFPKVASSLFHEAYLNSPPSHSPKIHSTPMPWLLQNGISLTDFMQYV